MADIDAIATLRARAEQWHRLYNLVASLGPDGCELGELVDEAHDLIRELRQSYEALPIHQRVWDLLRQMRGHLLDENLITRPEYAWLLSEAPNVSGGGSPAPRRLETYDELRARAEAAERETYQAEVLQLIDDADIAEQDCLNDPNVLQALRQFREQVVALPAARPARQEPLVSAQQNRLANAPSSTLSIAEQIQAYQAGDILNHESRAAFADALIRELAEAKLAAVEARDHESPILAFQAWCERHVADRGKPLTQDEYFLAQAAFFAAHPSQGPTSTVMAAVEARGQGLEELLRRAKLYVETVEVQPAWGDGERHGASDAAKELRLQIDAALPPPPTGRGPHIPCPQCGCSVAMTVPVTLRSLMRTPEEKVAFAKRLLIAATIELRVQKHAARAADRCACGHRRDEHTISYSINYTEGFCMTCPEVKGHSQCQWFNLAEVPMIPQDAHARL